MYSILDGAFGMQESQDGLFFFSDGLFGILDSDFYILDGISLLGWVYGDLDDVVCILKAALARSARGLKNTF